MCGVFVSNFYEWQGERGGACGEGGRVGWVGSEGEGGRVGSRIVFLCVCVCVCSLPNREKEITPPEIFKKSKHIQHAHTCTHMYTRTYTHTHIHYILSVCLCACVYACTYTHIYIHTYDIHTFTYIHTYIHAIQVPGALLFRPLSLCES